MSLSTDVAKLFFYKNFCQPSIAILFLFVFGVKLRKYCRFTAWCLGKVKSNIQSFNLDDNPMLWLLDRCREIVILEVMLNVFQLDILDVIVREHYLRTLGELPCFLNSSHQDIPSVKHVVFLYLLLLVLLILLWY